jgi:hypothetical protein
MRSVRSTRNRRTALRRSSIVALPLVVALLSGCAVDAPGRTATPIRSSTPTSTPSPSPTPSPTPSATPGAAQPPAPAPAPTQAPPPVPADGWTARALWDSCLAAHLVEFPVADGETIGSFDESHVEWSEADQGYFVRIASTLVQDSGDVDGTRVCLVQGTAAAPSIVVNPATE